MFKASRLPGAQPRCSAALRRAVVSLLSAARHRGAHFGVYWHFDEFSSRCSGHRGVLVPTAMFVALRRVLVAVFSAGLHPGAHLDGCWLLDVSLSRGKRQFDSPVLGHGVLGNPTWRRHRHAAMGAACSVRAGRACRRSARLARARCRLAASSLVAAPDGPSRRQRRRRELVPDSSGRAGGARAQSRASSALSGSSVSLEPPGIRPSGLQGRRCLPFDAPTGRGHPCTQARARSAGSGPALLWSRACAVDGVGAGRGELDDGCLLLGPRLLPARSKGCKRLARARSGRSCR